MKPSLSISLPGLRSRAHQMTGYGIKRRAVLLLVIASSVCLSASRAKVSHGALKSGKTMLARLSDEVSVQAAARGNPWISLSDGHQVISSYVGPDELVKELEENRAQPLSLASADFDEDGLPDLISGYALPEGGGIITLHRGNVDSIYPNTPEAKQRRAGGQFTDAPFLSPALVLSVPEMPDFVVAGDFDNDGHIDVIAAARGGHSLYFLRGDGQTGFGSPKGVDLPGKITAMLSGEINRRDGLTDLIVAVTGPSGPKVLVFEGPDGALHSDPEVIDLPAEATSLALGQLDHDYPIDLAIAAASSVGCPRTRQKSDT